MKPVRAQRPFQRIRLLLLLAAGLIFAASALASGGSYATAGTGTYAQSLWWLDFSGYSNSIAAAGGQAYSFTLPSGAGTLSTTVKLGGSGTLTATATPAWTGGAIGHGAYNGISGSPDLYWLNQTGTATVTLASLAVKDTAGNARSFVLYAADGENTNNSESIVYTSTAAWKLIDTLNYYASYNGGVPGLAGTGTATVTETAPAANDSTYNASVVLGTQNPTQASVALSGNEAALFAVAMPTVTLTLSIAGRASVSDEFTAAIAYTSPASALKSASTSGAATTASTGATAVIGTNSITVGAAMLSGSPSPLSFYTGSVACSNSGPGAGGYGGVNTVLPSGAGTSFVVTPQAGDGIACTLTLTPVTQTLTGTVYGDVNHDAALDNGETGSGASGLYVKLAAYSAGACQNPATAAAAVAASSGAFSMAGVAPGSYCLILTNSSALGNTTAYLPPGTVGTEAAGGIRTVTLSASPTPVQNFGLFSGSEVSLQVFADTGTTGGIANDGLQNGGEAGIGNVLVTAAAAGAAIATTTTGAAGNAVLWLPASYQGAVTLTPSAPGGDVATGGSAGTTGGTYARPSVTFTVSAGNAYGGVTFGLIPPSTLAPNGAQSLQPGSVVFYPHTFMAGSGGQVSFATAAGARPALAGWSEVLYLDVACSGQFAGNDTVISAPITVVAGGSVCILLREFAPANAPVNASNKVTTSATLTYGGAAAPASASLAVTDISTVNGTGTLLLTKRVQNVTAGGAYGTSNSALPGHTLQYQITLVNLGSAALSAVVVNDATPSFTTFLSAACPAAAALPPGMTSCTVGIQPTAGAAGGLQWNFAGSLAPGSQTAVTFQVQVAP